MSFVCALVLTGLVASLLSPSQEGDGDEEAKQHVSWNTFLYSMLAAGEVCACYFPTACCGLTDVHSVAKVTVGSNMSQRLASR